MAASRAQTRAGGAHREEEVKEQMTETIARGFETGKEMLASAAHGQPTDKLLALALLLHAAVNMWQGWSLLWNPQFILPGLFGFSEKLQWDKSAQHALLRAFGFQVRWTAT